MSLEASLKAYRQCFIDLAWAHWNRLGATGFGDLNVCSVDPEALLMLTSLFGAEEGRLLEIMGAWLWRHEGLISIERLKNLLKVLEKNAGEVETPEAKQVLKEARARMREVVLESIPRGQGSRWKKVFPLAPASETVSAPSSKKIYETDRIVRQNLLARLRYLFGPGSRADILYYALVVSAQKKNPFGLVISAPLVSRCTAYNASSVHRTLGDFEAGQLLKREASSTTRPIFHLHRPPYGKNEVTEKCFLNWFPIVGMAFWLERLRLSLESRPSLEESIVKSRLWRFISGVQEMAREAYIPLRSELSREVPMKDLGLEEMLSWGESLLSEVYGFVTRKDG